MVEYQVTQVKLQRAAIKVELNVRSATTLIQHILLKNRLTGDVVMDCPIERTKQGVQVVVPLSALTDDSYYYDFYLVVAGQEIRMKHIKKLMQVKLDFGYRRYATAREAAIIYPYVTAYGGLSINYRQRTDYDSGFAPLKMLGAFLVHGATTLFRRKKHLVFFEKELKRAEDNAYYLYQAMQANPRYVVQFIGDTGDENFIRPYSFKFFLAIFNADLFVSSEGKSHLMGIRMQNGLLRQIVAVKPLIFLQHGVLGLKNVDTVYQAKGILSPDFFVITEPHEYDIVHQSLGYATDKIVESELLRLKQVADLQVLDYVVYMPTWRKELENLTPEAFKATFYYQQIEAVRAAFARQAALVPPLQILLHPKLAKFQSLFPDTYVTDSFSKTLYQARGLLTDYSSVAWDFRKLKRPVVLYQWDRVTYEEVQGMYLDPIDYFDRVTFTPDELEAGIVAAFSHPRAAATKLEQKLTIINFIDRGFEAGAFTHNWAKSKYYKI